MAQFSQKHPTDLTRLVGKAVANGATPAQVQRDLAAGAFNAWNGPYQMPLETVRYYGKKERDKRAARTITPEARDNPKKAVDDLARLLLSAAQKGLEGARPKIDHDPKALKEWGDAIKTINALVSDTARPEPKTKRNQAPKDPLTARLTSPSPPTTPVDRQETTGEANGSTPINTEPDHDQPTPLGGVLLQPPVHGPSWGQ